MGKMIFPTTLVVLTFFPLTWTISGFSSFRTHAAETSVLEERCWTILTDALERGDPGEGAAAVRALSASGSKKGHALLREALDAHWSNVRAAAVRRFADMGQVVSGALPLDTLKRLLEEDDLEVQLQAAQALGEAPEAANASEILASAVHSENEYLRDVALLSLVKLAKQQRQPVVDLLRSLLRSRNEAILNRTVRVLGQVGGAEIVPLLRDTLKNAVSSEVRFQAAVALTRLGDDSAIEDVRRALASSDNGKFLDSILALYRFGDPSYRNGLEQSFQSTDSERRYTAVSAIKKTISGDPKPNETVIRLLQRAASDTNSAVKRGAVAALASLLHRGNADTVQSELVQLLRFSLTDHDEWVRVMVAKFLVEFLGTEGNQSAVAVLRNAVDSDVSGVRTLVLEGLAAAGNEEFAALIKNGLDDDSSSVVIAAIEGLVRLKDRSSLSGLIELLAKKGDQRLIESSTRAIVRLGQPKDVSELEPLLVKGKYGRYTSIYAAGAIIGLLYKEP